MDGKKDPAVGELTLCATQEEALETLTDEAKFSMVQLQSCSRLARELSGASVFTIVVLPTGDPKKARILSFSTGCDCPTCSERASLISMRMLEVMRDTTAEFNERVDLAHSEPGSGLIQ